eukprot:GEMP01004148.1.p1 GENE.GEMP01004148.1~~GEMP01004148.1.p1  ORF type:complete len:1017 (+),score=199.76 GEMP01004148.1:46-3051(+)
MDRGQRLRDALPKVFSVVEATVDPKRKDAFQKDVVKAWNDLRRGIGDTKKTPDVLDDFRSDQISSVWEFVMRVVEEYPRLSRQVFDCVAVLTESQPWRQGFIKAENQSRLALWKLDLPKRSTEHSPVTVIIKLIQAGAPVKALLAGGEESEVYRAVAARASELPSCTREFFARQLSSASQSHRTPPSPTPSTSQSSLLPSSSHYARTPSPVPSVPPRTGSHADSSSIVPSSSPYVGDLRPSAGAEVAPSSPSLPDRAVDDSTPTDYWRFPPNNDDLISCQPSACQPTSYHLPSTSGKDFLPLPMPGRPSGHRKTAASSTAASVRDSTSSRISAEYPLSTHGHTSVRGPSSSSRISAEYSVSHTINGLHDRVHSSVKNTDALRSPPPPTTEKKPHAHPPTRHDQHVPKVEVPAVKTTVNASVYWAENTTLCPDTVSEAENAADSSVCNGGSGQPRRSEVAKKAQRSQVLPNAKYAPQVLKPPSQASSQTLSSQRLSFGSSASLWNESSFDRRGNESSPRQSKLCAPSAKGHLRREPSPAPRMKQPTTPEANAHQVIRSPRNAFRESVMLHKEVTMCPRNAFQDTCMSRSASHQALTAISPRDTQPRSDISPRNGAQQDNSALRRAPLLVDTSQRNGAQKAGKWLEPDSNKQPARPIIRQVTIGFTQDSSPIRDTAKAAPSRALASECQAGTTANTVVPTHKPNKATKIPRRCPSMTKTSHSASSSTTLHHSTMAGGNGRIMMPPTAAGCSTPRSDLSPVLCASETSSIPSKPRLTLQSRPAPDFAVQALYPFNRSESSTSPVHRGPGRARSPAPLPIPRVAFPSRSITARRNYRVGSGRHRSPSPRPPSSIPRAHFSPNAYDAREDARSFLPQHRAAVPSWCNINDAAHMGTVPRAGCRELRSVPSLGVNAGFHWPAQVMSHGVVYNSASLSPHHMKHTPMPAPYICDFRADTVAEICPAWGAQPLARTQSLIRTPSTWSLNEGGTPMHAYGGGAVLPYRGG